MIKVMLATILLAGSVQARKTAKVEKPMEWKGQYGGPIDASFEVATEDNAWMRLWLTLGQDAPKFNFKKDFAVAIFAGERPMGGYNIEFLDPIPKGMDLIVRYRILPPSGFATQAITQPWKVRAFRRVRGKVFVEEVSPEVEPE